MSGLRLGHFLVRFHDLETLDVPASVVLVLCHIHAASTKAVQIRWCRGQANTCAAGSRPTCRCPLPRTCAPSDRCSPLCPCLQCALRQRNSPRDCKIMNTKTPLPLPFCLSLARALSFSLRPMLSKRRRARHWALPGHCAPTRQVLLLERVCQTHHCADGRILRAFLLDLGGRKHFVERLLACSPLLRRGHMDLVLPLGNVSVWLRERKPRENAPARPVKKNSGHGAWSAAAAWAAAEEACCGCTRSNTPWPDQQGWGRGSPPLLGLFIRVVAHP